MGSGNHHAQIDVLRGTEVGQARSRQHVNVFDVDAGAGQARCDRLREHGPRQARIPRDDGSRPPIAAVGQCSGGSFAQFERQLRGYFAVGQTPHTVSSKKSGHDSSPVREKIAIVTNPSMALLSLPAELLHDVSCTNAYKPFGYLARLENLQVCGYKAALSLTARRRWARRSSTDGPTKRPVSFGVTLLAKPPSAFATQL